VALALMFRVSDSPEADVRVIISSEVLLALLWLVRTGLQLDAFGFWPYMAICVGLLTAIIAAAFAWDWHEARSRR
jgi:hypothetical protein